MKKESPKNVLTFTVATSGLQIQGAGSQIDGFSLTSISFGSSSIPNQTGYHQYIDFRTSHGSNKLQSHRGLGMTEEDGSIHGLGHVGDVYYKGQSEFTIYPALTEEFMNDTVFMRVAENNVDSFQTKDVKLDNHWAEIILMPKQDSDPCKDPRILALVEQFK